MTDTYLKKLYYNSVNILSKLNSEKYSGVKLDNDEYAGQRVKSWTTKELLIFLKLDSYDELFDIINFLKEQNQIDTDLIASDTNNAAKIRNAIEDVRCTINEQGQKALRQKHYEKLISDVEKSETIKENNQKQHQSILDTNENIGLTNKIIWISVIATCISAVASIMTYQIAAKTEQRQVQERKLTDTINILKEQLQKESYQADVAKNLNDSLCQIIDSLTKTN